MKSNPSIRRQSLARQLLVVASVAAFGSDPLLAQEQESPQEEQRKKAIRLETVTVTGSHIANPNVVAPTPISVISGADIEATGAINISDLMTTLPQLATTFTMGNSGRFIGTVGVGRQDLRNLGTSRSLVLVNGRRFVGSSAGGTAVDVNLVPTAWVERVEIITGGASAVYGADAVTGVVNFILKKRHRGATLRGQYGTSEHGGFGKQLVSLTGGLDFAKERGNAAVSLEHSSQGALRFRDVFGRQAYSTIQTPGGRTDSALFSDAGSYTITEGGTFSLGSPSDVAKRYVFDPDGSVRRQRFSGIYDDSGRCANCDRLDVNQVAQLQPRYGRTTLSGVASFDLSPQHRLYTEGTYNHVDVKRYGQPAFGSGRSSYLLTRDNAFISPSLAALMDAHGRKSIRVARFDVDAGRRGEDTKRDTSRGVIGARGLLAGSWEYDTSLNYGVTAETRHNLNNRINDRFYASIDAVRDPRSGRVVCRSTLQPQAANPNTGATLAPIALDGHCVPTSIFGTGAINPAAARWFNTTTTTTSRLTQFVAAATVNNNDLFPMPFEAGAASMAAGVEFRRETSRQITDPLDVAGLTFLNAIPPSGGAYNVKEAYAETALPLLGGKPFAHNLTFDAAVRFSDYSTIGRTKAWRWGLDWAVNGNLRLRGTMSRAARAPNIGELYSGQSQNYFFVTDPCSVPQLKNAPDPAVRAANCLALGVPTGWVSTNSATIEGISGSNPELKAEVGRTWTAGFVFTPEFLRGFGLTADYWNIRLADAISAPGGGSTATRCVDSTVGIGNVYCRNALRDPVTHELTFIRSINQNISALGTSGVDTAVYYSHPLGGGKMKWVVDATRVISFTSHPFQDAPDISSQAVGTLGFPTWKASLRATYTVGGWVFNWNTRYFSPMLLVDLESYRTNPRQTTPIRAGAGFFNDARVSYTFGKTGLRAYLGLTNVFDRKAPVSFFGTGFGSALYDTLGRSYYAGINYNF